MVDGGGNGGGGPGSPSPPPVREMKTVRFSALTEVTVVDS